MTVRIVPSYWDEDLERMDPERLTQIRNLQMQKHLRYAYQNSLFYKHSFDAAGFRPEEIRDLEAFTRSVPFLSHMEMIENQQSNPPFGDFLALGLKDVSRIYASPGPLMMPFSTGDMEDYINTTANGLYICGARRGDIVDITAAYQWHLAGTMMDAAFRRIGCAVVPGGAGMSRTHILVMSRLKVTVMFAFPSFAMQLADTARQMGVDPATDLKLRLIILGTEIYGDRDKEMLADAFGAEIREMYGGAETGFVAAECPHGGGMHCFTHSITEVVDPATGRTASAGGPGEIVTTDLSRRAIPVIRYRTGDLTGGFNLDPCPCGRTSPRLKRIVGRTGPVGRVKGVYLIPAKVEEIIKGQEGLANFQILIDRPRFQDRITIRVETSRPNDAAEIKGALMNDLRAFTQLTVEIDLVEEGAIGRNAPLVVDTRFSQDKTAIGWNFER
jgi:phenylacetate-CoA ligase